MDQMRGDEVQCQAHDGEGREEDDEQGKERRTADMEPAEKAIGTVAVEGVVQPAQAVPPSSSATSSTTPSRTTTAMATTNGVHSGSSSSMASGFLRHVFLERTQALVDPLPALQVGDFLEFYGVPRVARVA